jgi:hypothetical protein
MPMRDGGSGEDLVVGGNVIGRAAADDYVAHRYHKPQDGYDPCWDWSGTIADLNIYYALGRQLAEGTGFPD